MNDDVPADAVNCGNVKHGGDARFASALELVEEHVHRQASARFEQRAHVLQERPPERSCRQALAAKQVDGDEVKLPLAGLDVLKGVGHDHFEAVER